MRNESRYYKRIHANVTEDIALFIKQTLNETDIMPCAMRDTTNEYTPNVTEDTALFIQQTLNETDIYAMRNESRYYKRIHA